MRDEAKPSTDDERAAQRAPELRLGATVRKRAGVGSGECGIIIWVSDDGAQIQVQPSGGGKPWHRQAAANFEAERGPPAPEPAAADGAAAPWYANPATPYPPEFTSRTVRLRAVRLEHGGVWWDGQRHSAVEWRARLAAWEAKYPSLVDATDKHRKRTPHEDVQWRTAQTSKAENISACWDALPRSDALDSSLQAEYRVDNWGNVVSIHAHDGALCKFDVDHCFPWSRGGRSVRANFCALQWDANRRVKSDRLLASLDPEEMRCGLGAAQLTALLEYAAELGGSSRRDAASNRERVHGWLRATPPKSYALSNFRGRCGSTDGKVLWRFFEQHERESRGLVLHAPGEAPLQAILLTELRDAEAALAAAEAALRKERERADRWELVAMRARAPPKTADRGAPPLPPATESNGCAPGRRPVVESLGHVPFSLGDYEQEI